MPKIIFEKNEKDLIPENLKDSAKELEDGTFELDAKGVLKKNKELLKDNASLEGKLDVAETAKAAAEARASEWKGKANLPEGKTIVDSDVAELGEAAKTAGLVKDEIPTLKTAAATIQTELDSLKGEKFIDEVAEHYKFNSRFKTAAKDKGLKFEKTVEGEGESAKTNWTVASAENKPKVEDFLKTDGYFKEFADTFVDSESGNQWVKQESGKESKTSNPVDAKMAKYSPPASAAIK